MAKKPTSKDWHRADIIAAVRKTGTNIQKMSRDHGFRRTTIGNALYVPAPKYERMIAEQIGTTPQMIWPSRYHADGTTKGGRGERGRGRYIRKTVRRNGSTVKTSCNVNVGG